MVKKIIIILAMILAIAGMVFFVMTPEPKEEKGRIEEPADITSEEFFKKNIGVVNEELYSQLSDYVYTGEVNYRNLVFEFKQPSDKISSSYTPYECSVYDPEDPQNTRTRYETIITDEGLELNYITGSQESTYEAEYDGDLTVNGVRLTKTPQSPEIYNIYN